MKKILDEVIQLKIEKDLHGAGVDINVDINNDEKKDIENILYEKHLETIKQEIREILTEEEKQSYEKEAKEYGEKLKEKIRKDQTKEKINHTQTIVREVIVLAIIVGLLVNQATDFLSLIKGTLTLTTCGIVLTFVFAIIFAGILLYSVLKDMYEIISDFYNNGE